ncbi:Rib/alpha-like domain-containing protein [Staphylococcus simulans]|uniref:Rib/alpha-like domain-containing protein n=2 Tax=Staphylococcus TaxID=1279 RepID=UPI0021D1E2A1|nr:Rib/alpha-like domain-containing protein [Staphylococcus simulans]UXR30581.1 Rib/alpha-like domain-containing protein [Staphylococcus simulans]
MKDEHTSKNKASFQPDRKNKYSIRKFTVGTASILVGAILLFGVNTQDAKAAETSTTSTVNATTPDKDTNVEVNHADAVVNETAVTTSSEITTPDETKEVPKTEVESLPTKASNDSTEKATSDHQEVVDPTVEKEATAAPKSQEVSTETAPFETNTTVQKVAETPKVEVPQSILDIQQVQDLNTAAEFYAQSSGVSIEEAQTLIQELNLDSQATPEEIQQALLYQLSHEYETWYKPAVREDLTTEAEQVADNPDFVKYAVTLPIEPIIIDADAIKNGYVRSGSDELSKTNLISGRAWMADQGIPSVGTNGLAPVPVNTPVYLQWMDKDGSISPIYRAYTHNKNRDDSAQDGPGAFAFDLRQGWTDATGKHHVYKAFKGQKYRFAIPDFTLPNGNKATMLRQAGGFYPGVFVDTFTDNNMGQTPVVGKNIGRTGIFMAEVPVGNYMTKPKNQWITSEGNHSNPELLAGDGYNVVRGKVWIESSGGDRANSATGPNYNPNLGDRVAAGYKVVLSSLTSQGAAAYRNEVQRVPVHERAAAAKRLLTAHPEYISATVVSVVDGNGVYAAKFPNGTLDVDHIYGFVLNTKGKLVQTYSGFTSPEFRKANQNISFVPISAPYSGVQQWANVNFAVVLSPSDTIDLHTVPYNATDNPAAPGSRVNVKLPNGDVPPMPTHIEWRDPSGQTVHRAPDFTTPKRGEQVSGFTIPKEAQEGDIYTAVLVSGGNDIAGSSVIVHITEANKYPPKAQTVTKEFGQPATEEDVMSHVTFPKYPTHLKKPTITIDHPDKLPDGNTPGKVLVPVTVTYPDGSVAHVNVPVVTKAQSDKDKYTPTAGSVEKDFGHKATPGEITGKVSVPDFPAGGNQPTYTVDETTIPDGQTPGTVNVPVTVHYPDNSSEVIEVPVTTKVQPDNDKYQPATEAIHKPFGQKTDENEVKSKVSVPNFPGNGNQPTYTVDTSTIPDGQTPGTVNVPVTVQYPDGTSEVVNVPVITGPKDSDTYQPTTGEITKPYGQGTTEQEVKDKVAVPNFPKEKGTPTIKVDNPAQIPNGQTPGTVEVPVTVTYPDGTKDHVKVPVTVGEQPQKDKYEPTVQPITKPYGQGTTEQEVKDKVTVPDFPKDKGTPTIKVDNPAQIPNGQTPGTVEVPVTVTYPDGTKDHVKVPVTVGEQPQKDKYEPTVGEITKPYGTPTTAEEVQEKVSVPEFPKEKGTPVVTITDPTKLPNGQTSGVFQVPVTVTYPDKTTDTVNVKVTVGPKDSETYQPTTGEITKPYGTPTTVEEVKGKVNVPNFPKEGTQPVITVDTNKLPNGQVSGETQVPVTVTYPDKTTDIVNVKVTTGPKDSDTYEPTTQPITKPFGQGTTEQEVKDKVTVPNFPADKGTPVVTVDDPTKLPDGNTHGVFDVPVTVTYPDKTTDKVTVKVTVGDQPQKDIYEPTTGEITKPYGTPTTEDEVKGKVSIPDFPKEGNQPVITVDTTKIPNGQTSGEFEVPVTVTYPDKTTDTVNVKVTVGPKDSDTYEPTVQPITKPYGQGTTEQEVKDKVTVPNFPVDKGTPVVTVDDPTKLPDGNTHGVFDVPVTVTYPDKTTDKVTVKVTVGDQPQKDIYEPTAGEIVKPYGTPTTEDEVKGKVSVPDFPKEGDQPVITVDTTKIPDGQTPGEFEVPATVTYPDKTTDTVNVKVTVGPKDSDTYEPVTQSITKPYGQGTTEQEVKDKVTVPNFPADKGTPVVTVDDPTKVPNGQTPGEFEVPVTVTYPDGTKDHVTVKVTVTPQPQNDKYEPTAGEITKPYGTPTTADEVKGKVSIPDFPKEGDQPVITVDTTKVPDGNISGEFEVPVTITYPDKTTDVVKVKVTVGPKDADTYEPKFENITKPFGQGTTEQEVKDKVTIPNFPVDKGTPVVTVDDPTKLPDGNTHGVFDVPVTVTYPDKTTDKVTVKVTVGDQPQKDISEPTAGEITKPYGSATTEEEVKGKVSVPGFPQEGDQPIITVDTTKVPDGKTSGKFEVPVTVTYPDKTTDTVNVKVTVGPKDSDTYEPKFENITKPYGQGTTEQEVKDKVTVPNFPADKGTPVVTVDDPTKLPDGNTHGVFDVPVTVTYPDGTKDHVVVKVTVGDQPENVKYDPKAGEVTKHYGETTTLDEVKEKVTVPGYPENGQPFTVTVDETKIPDGQTSGEFEVPVTVTYPDKTTDTVNVKVTVGPKDSDTYEPTVKPIEKPFGQGTTEQEVKDKVTVPNFPADKGTPVVTVDDPTKVPNGQTPGEFDVPVTVTYPDGTRDHVTVKVTVTPQPQNDKYEPTAGEITKPYGSATTEDEVKGKVSVPDFPKEGDLPVITVDTTKVPDGKTSGEFEVPVTVTYPDKTTDTVNVKVTVRPKDSDTYEPTTQPITKPFGQGTTEQEVKDKVTVPNFPADKGTPIVTVDDSTKVPNGQTPGTFDVPVTVTYPDGTKDYVTVKVTVNPQPQNDKYEPTAGEITKPYGTPTTPEEVKEKVSVPDFPKDGGKVVVTIDDPTTVPSGNASGVFEVPVTVTYPDGTKDHVTVKIVVTPQPENAKYEPVSKHIEKPYNQPTTVNEIVNQVTVPDYPTTGNQPKVTVDNPALIPDGKVPGEYEVPVTVTYPDGTKDHVTVKVVVTPQPENDKYEPVSKDIEKPYNQPTTVNEIVNQVTVPDYPTEGNQPKVTVDNPALIPDGKVPGEYEVPVTVTYPDGTKDHVSVKVVVGPKDSDTYEPTTQPIEKPYGSHTTIDEIVGKVTVPGYPDTEKPYKVTVDNPTLIPSGSIPGVYDVPVTVTYPDGTTDHINVTITVHPQPDADVYNPGYNDVQVNPGESIEIPQVKDDVPTGTRFEIPSESGIDKDWTVTVNPDTGKITVTVPEDAAEGDVVTVIVKVTYPDGSTENVTVDVTVHDSIAPEAPVVNPIEAGDRTVTGTGKEPGSTVTVAFPDGSTVTTKVDKDGNWKVDVPEAVTLKDGDNVKAVITDEAGNVSKETVTPVKDTVAPEAPVVNVIHAGDKVVTGTAEPGTTVTVTFPNGTVVTVKVGQDGTWSVDVPSNVMLKDGDKVTVVATDEAGNVSESSTAIVVGDKEVVPAQNKEKIKTPESGGTSTIDTNKTDANNKSSKVGVSTVKDESSNKTADKAKSKSTAKALPDTGKDTVNSGVLFGGLFAALGSILLFRRRRNHDDNK